MNPDRWHQIEQLYEAYLALPPEARAAFLDDLDDPALRTEIESLLATQEEEPAFLEDSFAGLPAPPMTNETAITENTRIGPYRLIQEVGRGGMGIVYLAERADGQFQQRVALKLLRRGREHDDLLSRFRYERQILAALDHPNIASLFDGGMTNDGRPYFVMEYVDGVPITEYADAHRLSTQQRLALFRTVCRAVQYAHQSLVIHRDLKPSNILITEDPGSDPGQAPQVKLLDFGIAKLLDEEALDQTAPHTATGLRLMTPEYASPEQIRGDLVTTQTDVYQLGVLLYELLTGRRPYRLSERMRHEVERVILEEEPTRPSTAIQQTEQQVRGSTTTHLTPEAISTARSTTPATLQRRLSGDLDTIVLTALKKEPERRYASVEALAEDIRRHLAQLPVLARPDTVGYRIAKFYRRHRLGVAVATAFVLVLLGFSVVTAAQSAQIRARANEVAVERDKAQEVADFLVDLFQAADPTQETYTVQELLAQGTEKIEALEGQPEVQASLMDVMGRAHRNLARYDEAERLARQALALRRAHFGADHIEVANSLLTLAYVRRSQGDIDEAEALFREALAISRKHQRQAHLAQSLYGLGVVLAQDRSDLAGAEPLFREALAIRRTLPAIAAPDLASELSGLGDVLRRQQRYDEAEPLFQEAHDLLLAHFGPQHIRVASSLNGLATLMTVQQKYDEAVTHYQKALDIYRTLLGPDHPNVATVSFNMGRAQMSQEHYAAAATTFREVLTQRRAQLGNDHIRVASVALQLGRALTRLNQVDEAEALLREALAIRQARLDSSNWQIAYAKLELGRCLTAAQRYDEAEPLLREGLARIEAQHGSDHRLTEYAREALADLQNAKQGVR